MVSTQTQSHMHVRLFNKLFRGALPLEYVTQLSDLL